MRRIRSVAAQLRSRLDWGITDTRVDTAMQRGTIARVLAYLYGFSAALLVLTLLVDGSPERNVQALALIAWLGFAVAVALIAGYDRIPGRALALAPSLASLLVGAVICFAGPEASPAYSMYFAWVVIVAAGYLSVTATIAHGAFTVAVCVVAYEVAGGSVMPEGLQLLMVAGTVIVAAVVLGGISRQLRSVVGRLDDAARTDSLTGLANRRALNQAFDHELDRAERTRRGLALVVLDLDEFKRYNDTLGHPAGDDALRRVARTLDEVTRSIETVGRTGGEEFAVIAPETDDAGAQALAERMRAAIESEFRDAAPPLTASCGVAVGRPGIGQRGGDLIAAADEALYAAKDAGRNRVVLARQRPVLELARASA